MTECLEIYRCEICGNIVQVLHAAAGELICCAKPMEKLEPKTQEEGITEKHVPIFRENKVYVGSVLHPMIAQHHIEFIETVSSDQKRLEIQFLDLGQEPSMEVSNDNNADYALEFCNLHGLWKGQK